MLRCLILMLAFMLPSLLPPQVAAQDEAPGFLDTPLLPGGRWHVHDSRRPAPPAVTPGKGGFTAAPSDALVLFDGKDLKHWRSGQGPARWRVEQGSMVVNGTGNLSTRLSFGDCQLHLEWAAPAPAKGSSQGRGNSGVYLMSRYEIQVLDSFQNRTYADGQAAALYGQWPPLVNACRPPGKWQSYDIVFRAPRFEKGRLEHPARVTVLHNGVLVHADRPFLGTTVYRQVARYAPHAASAPLMLQDHGNPVRYRNIWIRRLPAAGR